MNQHPNTHPFSNAACLWSLAWTLMVAFVLGAFFFPVGLVIAWWAIQRFRRAVAVPSTGPSVDSSWGVSI